MKTEEEISILLEALKIEQVHCENQSIKWKSLEALIIALMWVIEE